MDMPGDAQATGSTGLTQDQAAQALERLLAGDDGDSGSDEALETEGSQTSDEADGDEPEATEEDQSDEPEATDDEDEQPQLVTVKIDGHEAQVTLEEVIKGYQREADYTRKTMALADKAKEVDSTLSTVAQKRDEYETALQQIEAYFANSGLPDDDSDLAYLRYENPAEWSAQMQERNAARDAARQRAAAIRAERDRIGQERQEELKAKALERAKEEEAKLLAAIPEWSDPEKAKAVTKEIADYAQVIGIDLQWLADLADHRLVVALRDAAKYRALQAKKPELQKRLDVKTVKPGSNTRPAVSELTRSKQRLAKTGRVDDAAAALMHILK